MIKVNLNGIVVSLENEKTITYRDVMQIVSLIKENYKIDISIDFYKLKIYQIRINNEKIMFTDSITQFDLYNYLYYNYLKERDTYITKKDLLKAKEKFRNIFKDEMLTSAEYDAFLFVNKYLDLLIKEIEED